MQLTTPPSRLDRLVDHKTEYVRGPRDGEITLVEYGNYTCPHCRAANERIAQVRDQLGDRVCYLAAAGVVVIGLALLSRAKVYILSPYILMGVGLCAFVTPVAFTRHSLAWSWRCSSRHVRSPTWTP